jgi:hypothetical protein
MSNVNGFTLFYRNVDYFFITKKVNKTRKLATEICRNLQIPDNASGIDAVLWNLRRANLDVTDKGAKIYGNGFSVYDPRGIGTGIVVIELD